MDLNKNRKHLIWMTYCFKIIIDGIIFMALWQPGCDGTVPCMCLLIAWDDAGTERPAHDDGEL
jgi:hypothetical protein